MYVSPVLSKAQSKTPKEYTNRARDEIARKLNLSASSNTSLKHGPSPLQRIASIDSDSSLTRTTSNDSLETITERTNAATSASHDQNSSKRVKNIFGSLGKLRRRTSSSLMSSPSQESFLRHEQDTSDHDVAMVDDDTASINSSATGTSDTSGMQLLHPVPSIGSVSTAESEATMSTMYSKNSMTSSLFSNQNSLATRLTNVSQFDTTPYHPRQQIPTKSAQPRPLTLQEALPRDFNDMYSPELLADPSLLIDGRPMFTKRALLDWELNDIRSLLILEKLLPEWNGQLPVIYSPHGFKFEYLPLDADDQNIVKTLVESEIYKEANLDMAFRVQTAKYTLHAARSRHAQILKSSGLPMVYNNRLSKPEWRNVIENFLLNLGVEAQCRHDFKKACSELKRLKKQEASRSAINSSTSPAQTAPKFGGKNALLRKAIYNDVVSQSPSAPSVQALPSTKLTKEEKARLWTDVQSKVYTRIGLDWTPDKITS